VAASRADESDNLSTLHGQRCVEISRDDALFAQSRGEYAQQVLLALARVQAQFGI